MSDGPLGTVATRTFKLTGGQSLTVPIENAAKAAQRLDAMGVGWSLDGAVPDLDKSAPPPAKPSPTKVSATDSPKPAAPAEPAPEPARQSVEVRIHDPETGGPIKIEGDPDVGKTGKAEAFGRGAADTASLGGATKLTGFGTLLAATADKTPRAAGRGLSAPKLSPFEAMALSTQEGMQRYREADEKALRDRPGWYRGGQVTGVGLTAAAPLGAVAREVEGAKGAYDALRVLATVGKTAVVGGGIGATAGLANSRAAEAGDIDGTVKDVARGTAIGAVAAPVLTEAVPALAVAGGKLAVAGGKAVAKPVIAAGKIAAKPVVAVGRVAAKPVVATGNAMLTLAKKGAGKWADFGARVHGYGMPGELAEQARTFVARTPEGAAMRANALAGEEGKGVHEFSDQLSGLSRATDAVTHYANVSEKPEVVTKYMRDEWDQMLAGHEPGTEQSINTEIDPVAKLRRGERGKFEKTPGTPLEIDVQQMPHQALGAAQERVAAEAIGGATDAANFLRKNPNWAGPTRKLDNEISYAMQQLHANMGEVEHTPEASARTFIALDRLKRGVGKLLHSNDLTVRDEALKLYEPLRQKLEEDRLWGPSSAAMQRESNAAITRKITAENAGFEQKFFSPSPTERIAENTENLPVGDTAKAGSYMRGLGSDESRHATDVLRAGVRGNADLASTLARTYQAPEHIAAQAAQAQQFAGNLDRTLDQQTQQAVAARALRELGESQHKAPIGHHLMQWVAPHPAKVARTLATHERGAQRLAQELAPGAQNAMGASPQPGSAMLALARRGGAVAAREGGEGLTVATARAANDQGRPQPGAGAVGAATSTAQAAMQQSRGHELEQKLREVAETDPSSLGPYGAELARAAQTGNSDAMRAAIFKLQQDPTFRTTYLPQIEAMR